jgi:hypothetical protein
MYELTPCPDYVIEELPEVGWIITNKQTERSCALGQMTRERAEDFIKELVRHADARLRERVREALR